MRAGVSPPRDARPPAVAHGNLTAVSANSASRDGI
jgi:hypothetical protein